MSSKHLFILFHRIYVVCFQRSYNDNACFSVGCHTALLKIEQKVKCPTLILCIQNINKCNHHLKKHALHVCDRSDCLSKYLVMPLFTILYIMAFKYNHTLQDNTISRVFFATAYYLIFDTHHDMTSHVLNIIIIIIIPPSSGTM